MGPALTKSVWARSAEEPNVEGGASPVSGWPGWVSLATDCGTGLSFAAPPAGKTGSGLCAGEVEGWVTILHYRPEVLHGHCLSSARRFGLLNRSKAIPSEHVREEEER